MRVKWLQASWFVQVAKAKVACFRLELAWRAGYQRIEMVKDCLSVFNRVSSFVVFLLEFDLSLDDLRWLCKRFTTCLRSYVRRDGNMVGHLLARCNPLGEGKICLGVSTFCRVLHIYG